MNCDISYEISLNSTTLIKGANDCSKREECSDDTSMETVAKKYRSISSDFSDLGDYDYENESFSVPASFSTIPEERFLRTNAPLPSQKLESETSDNAKEVELLPGELLIMRVVNTAYIVFYMNEPAPKIPDSGLPDIDEQKDDDIAYVDSSTSNNESLGRHSTSRSKSFANLGAAGHKVVTINRFISQNSDQVNSATDVTRSLGRGLFRASHTLGRELFKGAAGLVSQTCQGSASGSILGFAKGLGMGVFDLGNHAVKGAVRGMSHVTNLVGEMVLGAGPHFSLDGILLLTNYRILWISQTSRDRMEIPVASLFSIDTSPTAPHILHLECRNPLRPTFAFEDEELCCRFISSIHDMYSEGSHCFALNHAAATLKEMKSQTLPDPVAKKFCCSTDLRDDYIRLNLDKNEFQLFDNLNWVLPSYPSSIVLPSLLTLEDVRDIADYRSSKRIPAVVWKYPEKNATMSRCAQPCVGLSGVVCAADQKLISLLQNNNTFHFIDARSQIAAAANVAQGKGTEDIRNYPGSELHYCDIMNIHAMRTSYWYLGYVCQPGRTRQGNQWQLDLANTQWLQHIHQILKSSIMCCDILCEGESLLIHCSDGWDRTPQLTSTTQLLLDPYYRTLRGFITLINKEWCSFGHMFRRRNSAGYGPSQQEAEEESPIFVQWLDCVWQTWRQHSWAFEFNEYLLLFIHDHVFTCLYGTFIYDCEKERQEKELSSPTLCLWDVILEKKLAFVNSLFDAPRHAEHCTVRLTVDLDRVVLWDAHVAKADPIYRRYIE